MNYSRGIIDVHAHILPGVDDGARNMEESVKMLLLAASQGVTGVIATPHYSQRRVFQGLDLLAKELENRIRKFYPDFFVYLGQETYFHEELSDRLHSGAALTLVGSQYVLVEFDALVSYKKLFNGIRKLIVAGYFPVLAHVERYSCLHAVGMEELIDNGCMLQMNYESLIGNRFSKKVRWCRELVKMGNIHLLGTDMHRLDYRPPEIDRAWRWLEGHISQGELERMTYKNPIRLIEKLRLL